MDELELFYKEYKNLLVIEDEGRRTYSWKEFIKTITVTGQTRNDGFYDTWYVDSRGYEWIESEFE